MDRVPKKALEEKAEPPGSPAGGQDVGQSLFPIVGIGASAGGLEAFTQLLSYLPANTGMAFVFVQHLDPSHPSQLASLLSKATALPVREIVDKMPLEPDNIYVIPPNASVILTQGCLKLTPRGSSPVPHPVDQFFFSLALEQQHLAMGVILSGTGSDGAAGLKEIKAAGGITFAQDEKSARFSGMPLQAGEAVDFILPPEKIALELARVAHDQQTFVPQKQAEAEEVANLKAFQRILALLRSRTGVDLSQYRDTTIKRRIQRRLLVRICNNLADYIGLLEKEPAELDALFDDALINVTSFFREPEVFETLKTLVFPELMKSSPPVIRVWVAGCSTGQEAYSLAIALLEFLEQKPKAPKIQIFATDIGESICIEKGRRGFYPKNIEAEVSPERLRRFFTKEDGGYRISKMIRDLCVFAKQNVVADPPFSRMDLVSCRNVLIYFIPALQRQVISDFHYALNPGGYLVLGSAETVGTSSDVFELLDRKHKIYAKTGVAAVRSFPHFAQDLKSNLTTAGPVAASLSSIPADFQKEADRVSLSHYAPAGVLINSKLEVLQFRGRTSPYLEPPLGEASFNLLKMARENLALELGTAIREAKKTNAPVRRNVRLDDQDTVRKVNLEIIPLKLSGSVENCFLVSFEEAEKARPVLSRPEKKECPGKKISNNEKDLELKQLRTELAAAREYLQALTEQHDAASEELKCANEEVLSSNEELQSTNEQLGTAKEELQSTNEELQTLNDELQTRNAELNHLNDLSNLLASGPIPILMLGNDLCLRRFNPAAVKFFQLEPTAVGRPIHSVKSPLFTSHLKNLVVEVIGQNAQKELEIQDGDGHWYSMRLHPYHTVEDRVDGVILTLVDIDRLKHTAQKLGENLQQEMDARRSAETANRAKDDFLAALSHELRTPLNPILLIASDAAGDRKLSSEVRANFETIRKNIELEARLIDDLLDMTRITSGKLFLETRILDAHLILQDAIATIRGELSDKQIELVVHLKASAHTVRGDATRLQQVFWNVLNNAVKFSPRGGKIVVETFSDATQLGLTVTDSGIGMTSGELDRLFCAFSQGDHARSEAHRFGGLGLGLAISRRLVELHSGHIVAASKGRDEGSTFTIDLPLAQNVDKNISSSESGSTDPKVWHKPQKHPVRVLLVDDHESTRDTLAQLLQRRQYDVLVAGTLADARAIAANEKIDFVISDIGLPDGSGNDLMAELRERYGLKGVALTGYGMERDIQISLTAGFVAHLTKPININSLEKVLATPTLIAKK